MFIAGTTRIHILGAGYLVTFGYFMLQGSRLLLQPVKITLRPRDCLVAYLALVVAVKTFLLVRDSPSFKVALCFPSLMVLIP